MAGPVTSPAAIRGGRGTARAGGRRGRGPRTPGSSGWAKRRNPRRTTRRVSPNQGEPFGLEDLVLSAHASHQLINLGDPLSDSGSVPEAAQVPARVFGGPRVRGLSDAQSPKAVPSRLTKPHRGSREGPGVSAQRVKRRRGLIRLTRFHPQTEADSVGSPPGWSATSRRRPPPGLEWPLHHPPPKNRRPCQRARQRRASRPPPPG